MIPALAIDLGGTKVEAALVDETGRVLEGSRSRATTGPDADPAAAADAVRRVVDVCRAHAAWPDVAAAGIGAAGPIDRSAGTISPVNLTGLRDWPVVDVVKEASGLDDVALRLDGMCIALAERWCGAARDIHDAIAIIVSTGIGGGVVSGGRALSGASGNAGHLGQTVIGAAFGELLPTHVDPADATVERLGSGPHVVAWAQEHGFPGSTGEDLAAAYLAGDPIARVAVARSARAVGLGLLSATTLLDLDVAVIGGGFSHVASDYCAQVEAVVRENAVNPYATRMRVVPAELGGDAPLVGAAALVHRRDLLG